MESCSTTVTVQTEVSDDDASVTPALNCHVSVVFRSSVYSSSFIVAEYAACGLAGESEYPCGTAAIAVNARTPDTSAAADLARFILSLLNVDEI